MHHLKTKECAETIHTCVFQMKILPLPHFSVNCLVDNYFYTFLCAHLIQNSKYDNDFLAITILFVLKRSP